MYIIRGNGGNPATFFTTLNKHTFTLYSLRKPYYKKREVVLKKNLRAYNSKTENILEEPGGRRTIMNE
jgi:hypothetical protein